MKLYCNARGCCTVNNRGPEDGAAVATADLDNPNPLFGDDADAHYQKLYEQIARQA
jgi:hypothetical protein